MPLFPSLTQPVETRRRLQTNAIKKGAVCAVIRCKGHPHSATTATVWLDRVAKSDSKVILEVEGDVELYRGKPDELRFDSTMRVHALSITPSGARALDPVACWNAYVMDGRPRWKSLADARAFVIRFLV
jgi:hypothetical protein